MEILYIYITLSVVTIKRSLFAVTATAAYLYAVLAVVGYMYF